MTSLDSAKAILSRVREKTDAVLVSYSGGKDSIVVLDLAVRMFPRVECLFMYFVPDLEHEQRLVDWPRNRYGIPVHQYPHYGLGNRLRSGTLRLEKSPEIPKTGPKEIYAIARKDTGIEWVLTGLRSTDSIFRRWRIRRAGTVDEVNRLAFPVADWLKNDILAYIKLHRLITPSRYSNGDMEGVSLHPDSMRVIREEFPGDYEKIKAIFPLVDLQFEREKIYGSKQAPKV